LFGANTVFGTSGYEGFYSYHEMSFDPWEIINEIIRARQNPDFLSNLYVFFFWHKKMVFLKGKCHFVLLVGQCFRQ